MKTFKHDTNERTKSNVLKLRMKYGAAGYGVYMMLLVRPSNVPKIYRLQCRSVCPQCGRFEGSKDIL
ncbi:MAG: DUF4373 domain-containing protein [Bacteroides sp.]|nr:DUF4373 domain-containing protein [Bacteroides sp.]MBD5363110.1 DUF4373 domain-containing protein [Bacteroides sp.]MBD5372582.1 DUF4373 domain-containing protein [Bacteroides sp.]